MKILILGAGAIGSLFGGFLAKAGHKVCFLGRLPNNNSIRNNGLKIEGIWGDHLITDISCFESLNQIMDQGIKEFDYVIVSVKSYDTEAVVSEYINKFSASAPVISLQNGLGNIEKIENLAGTENTIGGRVITGVEYINPGHIRVTVSASDPVLGAINKSSANNAVRAAKMFTVAGINTDVTDNIQNYIWEKILYNCALNALSTIININYGRLLSSPAAKDLILNIIIEIYNVIHEENIIVNFETARDYTAHLFDKLIPLTFDHHPSMLQDINHNKRTEIDALNGAIVEISKKYDLCSPYNSTITNIIKAKEQL
jgi:2-dehydropantoate 2-reductase